jgi:hypothetical protein
LTKTSETHTEVSIERKPENFPKFRAKMNYCVEIKTAIIRFAKKQGWCDENSWKKKRETKGE